MERINHPTATEENLFTEGNPANGTAATVVTAAIMNAFQEELARTVEAAGVTLAPGQYDQLARAVRLMAGATPGWKNQVLNGGMDVWQRGFSHDVADEMAFTADRWAVQADASTGAGEATVSRQVFGAGQTDVAGNPIHHLRVLQTTGASAGSPKIRTRLEDVRALAGRKVQISFWAKCTVGGGFNVSLTQGFGASGDADTAAGTTSLALSATWAKYTWEVTLPSIAGKSVGAGSFLEVAFTLPSGATFTFDLADVQVEVGEVPTEFDRRPFAVELQACQRYYEQSYPYGVAAGTVTGEGAAVDGYDIGAESQGLATRFRVEKRTTPSVAWYSPIDGQAGQTQWDTQNRTVVSIAHVSTAGTGIPTHDAFVSTPAISAGHWTATAEL